MDSGTLIMDESGFPVGEGVGGQKVEKSEKVEKVEMKPDEVSILKAQNLKLRLHNIQLQSMLLQHDYNNIEAELRAIEGIKK